MIYDTEGLVSVPVSEDEKEYQEVPEVERLEDLLSEFSENEQNTFSKS